jgi:hypothetical protein
VTVAAADIVTLSFAVTGQPNIAIGFKDIDTTNCTTAVAPALVLGSVFDEVQGQLLLAEVICDATSGALSVEFNGATTPLAAATKISEWKFSAADQPGFKWQTKASLLDIMCVNVWQTSTI